MPSTLAKAHLSLSPRTVPAQSPHSTPNSPRCELLQSPYNSYMRIKWGMTNHLLRVKEYGDCGNSQRGLFGVLCGDCAGTVRGLFSIVFVVSRKRLKENTRVGCCRPELECRLGGCMYSQWVQTVSFSEKSWYCNRCARPPHGAFGRCASEVFVGMGFGIG